MEGSEDTCQAGVLGVSGTDSSKPFGRVDDDMACGPVKWGVVVWQL